MEKNLNLAKVLFVEDSKTEFILTKSLLARENVMIDMDLARSGEEALKYLIYTRPDLIIIDKSLMLKAKFLDTMAKNMKLSDIPIAMMFGIRSLGQRHKNLEGGVVALVDKPINYDRLQYIVSQTKLLSFHPEKNKIYLYKKIRD